MQWSLKSLLIATAVLPVAIFAIANSTPFWVSAVVTTAGLAWIAVAIMAWVDSGQRRAWARGAMVAATGYAVLIFALGNEVDLYGSRLATSHLLAYAYSATHQPQPVPPSSLLAATSYLTQPPANGANATWTVSPQTAPQVWSSYPVNLQVTLVSPQPSDFGTIGHVYWGLLIALIGGRFAMWIERRQKASATESAEDSEKQSK